MKPTAAQLRQLKRDNLKWPTHLTPIPRDEWPAAPFVEASERLYVWRSRQFLCQLFLDTSGLKRLSICRTEWDERTGMWRDGIGWDELQNLKAEAGFADTPAVELFPPDSCVVNVANMRHLWLLAEPPAFMWIEAKAKEAA